MAESLVSAEQTPLATGEIFDIREAIDLTVLGHAWDALSENTRRAYTEAMIRCAIWVEDPTDDRLAPKARKRDYAKARYNETPAERKARLLKEYLQAATVLPLIDDKTLADYVKSMDQSGLTPAAIAMSVAAVKWGCKNVLRAPSSDWTITTKSVITVRRDSTVQKRGQVKGLTWTEVDDMLKLAEAGGTAQDLRDASLILLMSDCLLRVSEAVAVNVEDIEENSLTVQRSKTDQTGETKTLYIGDRTKRLIKRYCRKANITNGAIFVRFKTSSQGPQPTQQRLSDRSARDIIKRWANLAGIEGRISGHSLRVGSAVSLAKNGASIAEMQEAGRWESKDMPGHYARVQEAEKGAIARYRYGKGK